MNSLGTVTLTLADTVTLADAKEVIQVLNAATIGALAGRGIDIIDSTSADNALSLRVDQYQALGTVALTQSDTVTLADAKANIETLDVVALGLLGGNGVDVIDATDDALSLSVAKFKALARDPSKKVALTQADVVTLADTGSEIAKLSASEIADLGARFVDRIDASSDLALTVAQYRALGAVSLTAANKVTIADTGANIALLSATEIGNLAANGIDFIDSISSDNALSLRLDQYQQLGAVKLTASDVVTLADTGANIASLTPDQFRALAAGGVDKIDLTNNAVDLTLAQYKGAIATVTFAADDKVSFENVRDFNHDGRSDVVLQSSVTGDVYLWNMDGKSLVSYGYFGWTPGSNWVAKATGDFDNNGYADVLLQNSLDGACYIWEKAGPDSGSSVNNSLSGKGFVGWTPGADWKVVGSGDFNGDHTSDILLQNDIDGSCYIWEVDSKKPLEGANALKASGFVGWTPGPDWEAKGIGDFNGDGVSDILLQNAKNGDCFVWEVDGSKPLSGAGSIKESGYIGWKAGLDWQAKAVGDFNNDGKDDVLLQNAKDGSCYIWELNGVNGLVDSGFVGWAPGTTWQVKSSGDFNGDGKSDVLLQNSVTNECYVWQLNGTGALVGAGYVGWDPASEWHALV